MSNEIYNQLQQINGNIDNIQRSYSGKRGCMCGCLGKYSTKPVTNKNAYNTLIANPDAKVDVVAKCLYVQTDTRINVVYFNQENTNEYYPWCKWYLYWICK